LVKRHFLPRYRLIASKHFLCSELQIYIQGVPGGIVNIVGGGSMDFRINRFVYACVLFSMGVEIQLFEVGARVCRLSAKRASTIIGGGSFG
jgi:hypothetical protein